MSSIRQEKVARVIKEVVSDAIQNRLSDPRIKGFTSVTKVDLSPDLKNADIFLSVMGIDDTGQRKTFAAIEHASKHIRSLVSRKMNSRFCPNLHFYKDEGFKKALETMKLINDTVKQSELDDANKPDQSTDNEN